MGRARDTNTYRVHLREEYSQHDIQSRNLPPEVFCEDRINRVLAMDKQRIIADAGDHRMCYLNNKSNIEKEYWWDSENRMWKISVSFSIPLIQFEKGEKIKYGKLT